MIDIYEFLKYSIFELLQFLWCYYGQVRHCKLLVKEVPSIYFYYIRCCTEACLKKWRNDLPDFYFLKDRIEQQVEHFFLDLKVMNKTLWTFCMK